MDGIKLKFDEDALDYIVDKAVEYKLGASGLALNCGGCDDGCYV